MLNALRNQPDLTDQYIGEAAGLSVLNKWKAVSDAGTVNTSISYALADWVLNRTFINENHFERGMVALEMAGLNGDQLLMIRNQVTHFLETNARLEGLPSAQAVAARAFMPTTKPPRGRHMDITADHDNGVSAMSLHESAPIYPVKKKTPVNRRDELYVFNLFTFGDTERAMQGYGGVAAGPGRALERCSELLYVGEPLHESGYCYARLHAGADSMLATILPGDAIVLREFQNFPPTLPALESDDDPSPINRIRSQVDNDTIWIVQINEDEPTLKRVRYQIRNKKWKMLIEADNPNSWETYVVEKTDYVRCWAQLKGLANISRESA